MEVHGFEARVQRQPAQQEQSPSPPLEPDATLSLSETLASITSSNRIFCLSITQLHLAVPEPLMK